MDRHGKTGRGSMASGMGFMAQGGSMASVKRGPYLLHAGFDNNDSGWSPRSLAVLPLLGSGRCSPRSPPTSPSCTLWYPPPPCR
eukprot:22921-Pyramimonas_sp.AAC.1